MTTDRARHELATQIVVALMEKSGCPVVIGNGGYDHANLLAGHLADALAGYLDPAGVRAAQAEALEAYAVMVETQGDPSRPMPPASIAQDVREWTAGHYADALAPTAEPGCDVVAGGTYYVSGDPENDDGDNGEVITVTKRVGNDAYFNWPDGGLGSISVRFLRPLAPTAEEAEPEPCPHGVRSHY